MNRALSTTLTILWLRITGLGQMPNDKKSVTKRKWVVTHRFISHKYFQERPVKNPTSFSTFCFIPFCTKLNDKV